MSGSASPAPDTGAARAAGDASDLGRRLARLERRVARERSAREHAEWLLEAKSLELFEVNRKLHVLNEDLERRIRARTRELERERARALALAERDQLTQLANRMRYQDELERRLKRAERSGQSVALLLLDLDHFKQINDSLGHAAGDELLVQAAERLRAVIRGGDLVARLGGDEFAIIADAELPAADVPALAERVLSALGRRFEIAGQGHRCTGSIGAVVYPADAATSSDLQRCADMALYHSKARGRGLWSPFTPSLLRAVEARRKMDADLRAAVEADQIEVWFQPRVELATGRPQSVEILARWRHPQHGYVPPGEFVALAEESDLINALGRQVLGKACRHGRELVTNAGVASISVNLSPKQLHDQRLGHIIGDILAESGLPPERLELEITENLLLSNLEAARTLIEELAGIGVRFSLDDFGTGYSNLSYLHRLPLHALKIDRSFVSELTEPHGTRAIVATIVELAHRLRLAVVAEGIESGEHVALLRELACDEGQGFYFARPMPFHQLRDWLRAAGGGRGGPVPARSAAAGVCAAAQR